MDTIFIRDLAIDTVIGIFDWERKVRQTLIFDLEMDFDIRKAAVSDDIADTLDYKAVSQRLIDYVGDADFLLVEALIENMARLIVEEFGVSRVKISLNKKGALRGAKDVGIIIERSAEDYAPNH